MKNFLSTFAICFVLCGIFLFFGGFLILSNLWLEQTREQPSKDDC